MSRSFGLSTSLEAEIPSVAVRRYVSAGQQARGSRPQYISVAFVPHVGRTPPPPVP
jgi:hypothetical protein